MLAEEPSRFIPPGADIVLDRKMLKALTRRSDARSLLRLGLCVGCLGALGFVYALSFGHWTFWPALLVFGGASSLTLYSLSHECSHGTVFRTRWLNETVFWITSLLFGQEVLYRRYSHAAHHTYTMYVGKDAQLPIVQPASGLAYLIWYTGVFYHFLFVKILVLHALGKFTDKTREFIPIEELPRVVRNSRIFLGIYGAAAAVSIYLQSDFLLWFWLIPKLAGDPIMMAFAGSQHFEKSENVHDLRESTRSLQANPIIDLFYWNMSYHIEHHLYPMVPYHALPRLNAVIRDQLPKPKGIVGSTADIARAWLTRATARPFPAESR